MARRITALAGVGTPQDDSILRFDEAPEFNIGHQEEGETPIEDMDQQVKEAQQRLAMLRAQQEEVERQKQILESLRQKQERFVAGKKDVTEKLDRCMRAINDELDEARRRVENLAITQQDFQERMEELKTFLPERWHRSQLDTELDRALGSLDEAEASYEKGMRRLHAAQQAQRAGDNHSAYAHPGSADEDHGGGGMMSSRIFGSSQEDSQVWLRRGFAFTLPLIGTILIALVLAKLMF